MAGSAEWRAWDLDGLKVTQLCFDFRFHVHMWTLERELLISFGTPFMFRAANGHEVTVDPAQKGELSPLLTLFFLPVRRFAASSEGHCLLEFSDGTELRGEPHELYEAWESQGTGDLESASLLCDIGGGSPWG